jgi:isoleucyl-tRNA synthetase
VDELSNGYVRRSRRRFWNGEPAALATLHECLDVLTRLLAPIVPFITERVWQDLIRPVTPDAPVSVHLASWPVPDPELVEPALARQMALVRRLVELGRASRADSGVRTRQPLRRALVAAPGWADLPEDLRAQLADELNVREIASMSADQAGDGAQSLLDYTAKANFRALGKRFGKRTPTVAAAIADADAARLAAELRAEQRARVELADGPVELTADEVVISEQPRSGWAVATEAGETVALDLTLTEELRRAGLAREAVRLVQEARKSTGLDVADRIELWWTASVETTAAALRAHAAAVADEVLATAFTESTPPTELPVHADAELGLSFALRRVGAGAAEGATPG